MTLSEQQRIFTRHIGCLIEYAYSIGIELTLGEAHRTQSQVLLNYFGYEVRKGGVLGIYLHKAKRLSQTLSSLHLDRLAVDFNFFINGGLTYEYDDIKPLGDYWESLHEKNRWGGFWKNFKDVPHFQMDR